MTSLQTLALVCTLAPLAGAAVSGLLCLKISNRAAHAVTILGCPQVKIPAGAVGVYISRHE